MWLGHPDGPKVPIAAKIVSVLWRCQGGSRPQACAAPSGAGPERLGTPAPGRTWQADVRGIHYAQTAATFGKQEAVMEFFRGRLIDHVHLRAADLEKTKRFYRAILTVLGKPVTEDGHHLVCDELWIDALGKDAPASRTHVHLAFQATDRDQVRQWHEAGLAAGGTDNGGPGERSYHPGYYAAFLIDPDGNNVEAVHHGPARRSAEAVVWTL
jgi:catechol 2,3-dioxygenase-like lactoylglutathione lyase family enzyme